MSKKNLSKKTKDILSELDKDHFRVSIFGSARIKRGDKVYAQVYDIAKTLGEMNIDVVTGGGPGLMEAANRGHRRGSKKNESHSIGLAIRLPKEQLPNNSLDIITEFDKFSSRLDNFMLLSDAVVVAPGGIGTALELLYTWQLVQTKKICDIPIIFLGEMWQGLIDWFSKYPLKKKYLDKEDMKHLFIAKDCNEVIKIIKKVHSKQGEGIDLCKNHKKYKLN